MVNTVSPYLSLINGSEPAFNNNFVIARRLFNADKCNAVCCLLKLKTELQ